MVDRLHQLSLPRREGLAVATKIEGADDVAGAGLSVVHVATGP